MGEYIKTKNGETVKLGTCEDMLYVTYDQLKKLVEAGAQQDGTCNAPPPTYLKTPGLFFAFPNPHYDGDATTPGLEARKISVRTCKSDPWANPPEQHKDICKGISDDGCYNVNVSVPCPASGKCQSISYIGASWPVNIVRQKLMPDGSLALVLECGWCKQWYRLTEEDAIKLAASINAEGDDRHRENTRNIEPKPARGHDWHAIVAERIVDGYQRRW